jgi:hypothetical protein
MAKQAVPFQPSNGGFNIKILKYTFKLVFFGMFFSEGSNFILL